MIKAHDQLCRLNIDAAREIERGLCLNFGQGGMKICKAYA